MHIQHKISTTLGISAACLGFCFGGPLVAVGMAMAAMTMSYITLNCLAGAIFLTVLFSTFDPEFKKKYGDKVLNTASNILDATTTQKDREVFNNLTKDMGTEWQDKSRQEKNYNICL
jgi:hypothetical protein